mgnify:CR=1 FL=1
MNCIIVEDQAPAQRVLKKYISDLGTLTLKGVFNNAVQAAEFLKSEPVDLMFLDIHLPKVSGIDFLNALVNRPSVILTTAFSEYAVQSYELDVVDYLIKPFSFERFLKAIAKVNRSSIPSSGTEPKQDFYIKSGHEYIKVNNWDILYIKSDMDYTEIHLLNKKLISTERLSFWEQKLAPLKYVRVHKSFLINTNKIEKVAGNQVYLTNQQVIPIGRAYKEEFLTGIVK